MHSAQARADPRPSLPTREAALAQDRERTRARGAGPGRGSARLRAHAQTALMDLAPIFKGRGGEGERCACVRTWAMARVILDDTVDATTA